MGLPSPFGIIGCCHPVFPESSTGTYVCMPLDD